MSGDREFLRATTDWLEAGSDRTPSNAVDAVLLAVRTTRQDRVLPNPWRYIDMNAFAKALVVATAVVAVALAWINFGPSGNSVGGGPTPTPIATPTPTPAPTPLATPGLGSRFSSTAFAVPVSFSLAGGWTVNHDLSGDIDLGRDGQGAGGGVFDDFTGGRQDAGIMDIGSTTVAGKTPSDPRMPWPKDLYAWLQSRPEFKPQPPKAITVGGRPATQIDADVTVPDGTRIELVCPSCWLLDHNDRWRFVEVKNSDGSGVVWITNGIAAPGFDAFAQALDQLLGTFEFR